MLTAACFFHFNNVFYTESPRVSEPTRRGVKYAHTFPAGFVGLEFHRAERKLLDEGEAKKLLLEGLTSEPKNLRWKYSAI